MVCVSGDCMFVKILLAIRWTLPHLKETCKQLFTIWHCFILYRMSQVDCLDVSLGILILNVCTLSLSFITVTSILRSYHAYTKQTSHSPLANYVLYRVDNRGMSDSCKWRRCDMHLQPPHQLCNPCG